MTQAACKGYINFSDSHPSNRLWWLKLHTIIDEIEKSNFREIQTLQHNQNCAVCNYLTDEQQFKHHWAKSSELITNITNSLFPWWKSDTKSQEQERQDSIGMWEREFGKRGDPEVEAKIMETARFLMRNRK